MPRMIVPKADFKEILRERRRCGADRYDEVWDGVYVMSPAANNEHQELSGYLASALGQALGAPSRARVFPGCNVSDNESNWTKNFRCPDVAVFLSGNLAEDKQTHWLGGPDFAVEIRSKGDRSRKKFGFYSKVHVRELLLVDRKPWKLELYRCDHEEWTLVGVSNLDSSLMLFSEALSLSFRLIAGADRPQIEVTRTDDGRIWLA